MRRRCGYRGLVFATWRLTFATWGLLGPRTLERTDPPRLLNFANVPMLSRHSRDSSHCEARLSSLEYIWKPGSILISANVILQHIWTETKAYFSSIIKID